MENKPFMLLLCLFFATGLNQGKYSSIELQPQSQRVTFKLQNDPFRNENYVYNKIKQYSWNNPFK
jgi:hypothetical protein